MNARPQHVPALHGVPQGDANSMLAHTQLVHKARQGGIDLYFLGDSITRRWGCTDPQWDGLLANWRQHFFGWNAANFGWGADRIRNVLWRVENGELDGVNPKVIVLLAGTNDVGNIASDDPKKVVAAVDDMRALLDACRARAPHAKIILMAIFPRNDNPAVMPEIDQINASFARFADGKTVYFLNINNRLTDAHGTLVPGVTIDGLHLSAKGYDIWAGALRPLLTRFLGPRAATDHAPPPTGDPSLRSPATTTDPRS